MISRGKKETIVAETRAVLASSRALLVAENRGLSAAEIAAFRREVRGVGGRAQIVKNTLIKLAMTDTAYAPLGETLSGALIYGTGEDSAALAKVFADAAKNGDKLILRGGALAEGTILDSAGVGRLAAIPPRPQLLAMLLSALSAPIAGLGRTLNQLPAGLARTLAAVRDQKAAAGNDSNSSGG